MSIYNRIAKNNPKRILLPKVYFNKINKTDIAQITFLLNNNYKTIRIKILLNKIQTNKQVLHSILKQGNVRIRQ